MKELQVILSVIVTILGLLGSTLTFLTKFIKNAKAKKKIEQLFKLTSHIIPLIEEAEKFTHYTGHEKKEYVMTKIFQLSIKEKLIVSAEEISEKIEELVGLTKQVNIGNRVANGVSTGNSLSTKELSKLR